MKTAAKESDKVVKARKKLKKQIASENKRINENALKKMEKAIEYWLDRHSRERISLKDKEITLFDANLHAAKTKSKYIVHLMENLKAEMVPKKASPLEGRIST